MKMMFSRRYRNFFFILFVILLSAFFLIFYVHMIGKALFDSLFLEQENDWHQIFVKTDAPKASITSHNCNHYNCFNIYRCGRTANGNKKLSVFVYPFANYVDGDNKQIGNISLEFYRIIDTIKNSEYYTKKAKDACILIPPVDTLNENVLDADATSKILAMLPHWNDGENHLLFNFLPGSAPLFVPNLGINRGKALVAGSGMAKWNYRKSYDISLPLYNPKEAPVGRTPVNSRQWFLVSSQLNIDGDLFQDLHNELAVDGSVDVLILNRCLAGNFNKRCFKRQTFLYPDVLRDSKFCVVVGGGRLGQVGLFDAMRSGCIPVIVNDELVLPFNEVIDWREAAIRIYEEDLGGFVARIKLGVSAARMQEMQRQVLWLFEKYFSDISKITLMTLKILNDRVFPSHAATLHQWNTRSPEGAVANPLFLPRSSAPKKDGFTAVILTYDRLESLFQVIGMLSKVESLTKIVVIWNNQIKSPPAVSLWPKLEVPLKLIQTKSNRLSHRFYPFHDIETECILALDDDINMMTADEIEFAYQVWREFPDRLVGFPSRNVIWNNQSQTWKYDSEWTNEISMVLTGIAFYHKYWNYAYTTQLPKEIQRWVDEHMNCEDIAMNFLIANLTGQAPIKVTPRKKFRCSECTSVDLSANEVHMNERSQCVNQFTKVFGMLPLKSVEFRVDPLLYLEDIPNQLKLYHDIGAL